MNIDQRADERVIIVPLGERAGDLKRQHRHQHDADGPGEFFTVHELTPMILHKFSQNLINFRRLLQRGHMPGVQNDSQRRVFDLLFHQL